MEPLAPLMLFALLATCTVVVTVAKEEGAPLETLEERALYRHPTAYERGATDQRQTEHSQRAEESRGGNNGRWGQQQMLPEYGEARGGRGQWPLDDIRAPQHHDGRLPELESYLTRDSSPFPLQENHDYAQQPLGVYTRGGGTFDSARPPLRRGQGTTNEPMHPHLAEIGERRVWWPWSGGQTRGQLGAGYYHHGNQLVGRGGGGHAEENKHQGVARVRPVVPREGGRVQGRWCTAPD